MTRRTMFARSWSAAFLASLETQSRNAFLESLSPREATLLAHDWRFWARDDQLPPEGDWSVWLVLGGRGSGKTRTGAEWILEEVRSGRANSLALIGETLADARDVMVEGESGLIACAQKLERPRYLPSKRRVEWPNGARALLFSATDPDSLRGPQFDAAWGDEFAKWNEPQATFDMVQMGLRRGKDPRLVLTTTPRPIEALKKLMADPMTIVSRSSTAMNAANLAPAFMARMEDRYAGTRLGRQELMGELITSVKGALFTHKLLESCHIKSCPTLQRIVIGVDPPVTSGPDADACGIVVAGRSEAGNAIVLADGSLENAAPHEWAARVAHLYQVHEADLVAAEVNQGGDLVEATLRAAAPHLPIRKVRATRGKHVRAEPVAALYAQGRVQHLGTFAALEDEMCAFVPGTRGKSPDRMDALVWALTELMLDGEAGAPRVRPL